MKNIAVIGKGGGLAYSTTKIAVGLNDYLNGRCYSSRFYHAEENIFPTSFVFSNKVELAIHKLLFRLTGKDGGYSHLSTRKMLREFDRNNVDTVYILMLHSFFINETMLFDYIKKRGINVVYIMLDEYVLSGKCHFNFGCKELEQECRNCPHLGKYPACILKSGPHKVFLRKKRNYEGINMVFVGPEMVLESARRSPLTKDRVLIEADECIDTRRFHPRNTAGLRRELGIPDDKIICMCVAIYDGIHHERKGVPYYIELARRFESDDRFVFVQVGYVAEYPGGLPKNYIAKGFINDIDTVAEYLSLGDLFIFPSVADTMPNTCIEALSCGTPLLCWKIYGNEKMAPPEIATFVTPTNLDEMAAVVGKLEKKSEDMINKCREYAVKRYDNQAYFEKLMKIGEALCR